MALKYDVLDRYWQEIKDIPTLTEEEEHRLAAQIQSGNERAVDRLVTANLRFVVSIARQYANDVVGMDDLISEGNIAMMIAARKWNPQKDGRFCNYAVWDVKKAMQQALPEQGAMLTLPKNDVKAGECIKKFSTDAPLHPGQTVTFGEKLKAGKPDTQDEAESNEISYALTRALHVLNEREQIVIKAFYGLVGQEHQTMAEIGQEHGYTRERVRQIRKTAERKIRKAMKK